MLSTVTFREKIQNLCPDFQKQKFLLAVSGGPDSMVLADLFLKCGLHFQAAHINYRMRDDDSEADRQLTEDFCSRNQIPFHLYTVSDEEKPARKSIQLWARHLRYDFFRKIMAAEGIDFLVTAHHLNDELETFLINLSRGSGIAGLSGIPAQDNHILRPLLSFSKKEIYAYAETENIQFREDLSNQKNDYLRNAFRNKAVPVLQEIVPDFLVQFSHSIRNLHEADDFIQRNVRALYGEILKENLGEKFILDKQRLLASDPFLIREIIRSLGFTGQETEKVIHAENGKFFRSKSHEIQITKKDIICLKKLGK